MALTPGDHIGAYEIVSLLGVGGMGEVDRARDAKLARDVAVKVLPDLLAKDPERRARFEREAQVLASLNHPHIAHIHGFDDSAGVAAIVMELVEGPTLADRIARGPVPLDEALAIARQIVEGLEAAHEQGIVHRDLKPANIKVRDDGTVKILDFGLAKAIEPQGASSPNVTQSPTLTFAGTQIGVILGTAAYMSPEQAKGRAAYKRSDLWAFGCVLYEMLTGKRAFEGEDVGDTLAFIITKQPDFSELPKDTPASIHKLLRRCLEKDRRRRIADASDARLEIEDASTAPVAEPTHTVAGRRRVRPAFVVASFLGAVVFTTIGLFVGRALRQPALSVPIRFAIPIPESQANGFTSQGRQSLAISPDGTQVVYSSNDRLYLRGLSDFDVRPIVGSDVGGNAANPVFSPDGPD